MAITRPMIDGEYGTPAKGRGYGSTPVSGGKKVVPRPRPNLTLPAAPRIVDAKDSPIYRPIPQRVTPASPPAYGGGGGYGGRQGITPSPLTPPASPPTPPAPPINLADLEAALASLEARFGMSREQLLGDQSAAGDQFRYIMTMLHRSRQNALQGSTNQAIGRGVLRSGLYLQDQSRIANEFAAQRAQEEAAQAARLRAIQEALAQLELQLEQDKVAKAQEFGAADLDEAKRLAETF